MTDRDRFREWVGAHRILSFYVLALGISWSGFIPYGAAQGGYLRVTIPFEVPVLTQFGPSIAAFVVSFFLLGRAGITELLGRAVRWRFRFRWYAIALLLTPVVGVVILLLHYAFGDRVPSLQALGNWHIAYAESFGTGGAYSLQKTNPSMGILDFFRHTAGRGPWYALMVLLFFAITAGPISEEFGWRGWALPRLQSLHSPLGASMLVGLLWGLWHTGPDFWRLLLGGNPAAFLYPLAITGGTLPLSILFTWMYNNTGGSLICPMLCHASFNSTLLLLTLVWEGRWSFVIGAELVAGLWLIAMAVVRLGTFRRTAPAFA